MSDQISTAVAKRDNSPAALVGQYRADFAAVLPSHVNPDTFVRVAQGALRRDRNLAQAASKDPGSLMSALLEAARLGLEPGTDEFYLTPRGGKVLGITGWKGEVELIYRAGAVSSVIAETVCANDVFEYQPGQGKPHHVVDWFGDRGQVRGAYAYAVMKDGAISKVAIVGPAEIKRAMEASGTAQSSHSPWKTDFGAMVLKTAVHRLAAWVPSSAEYRREQLRAVVEAHAVADAHSIPVAVAEHPLPPGVDEDGVIEAEVVEESA